jgi:hypothetical protein
MLGMTVTINANVDRITIDSACLNHNLTLEELHKKLIKLTHNVRTHSGHYPRIEVFFNANDYDNLPAGYEKEVMQVIKENTHRVILFSNDMTLQAEFEPALQ